MSELETQSTTITLDKNNEAIRCLCQNDAVLARLIEAAGPLRYKARHEEPFSFVVHQIIEQMLSIRAADKICGRLKDLCGGQITPQSVSVLSEQQIRSAGTSAAKAKSISALAKSVASGEFSFDDLANLSDNEVTKRLTAFKGIGNWTAKMFLIFILDRPDVLPFEDATFVQSYKRLYKTQDASPAAIKEKCAAWKPYSSVAARYLYEALDSDLYSRRE